MTSLIGRGKQPVARDTSSPTSTWRFDTRLASKGTAALRGVTALSTHESWAVGSEVDPATDLERALVGRWNGGFAFVPAAPADPSEQVRLIGVDSAGDEVWAVGQVSDCDGGWRTRIERYHRQPTARCADAVVSPSSDRDSALHGVAMVSATDGWAVGGSGPGSGADFTRTLIARWDGTAWCPVPSPSPGTGTNQLDAVAARASDDVWAVGHSTSAASADRAEALVLHWDGSSWDQVPVPDSGAAGDQLLGIAFAGPEEIWAVGTSLLDSAGADDQHAALALRWDGSAWQVLRPAAPATQFSAATATSATDVWFAGYAQRPGGPETANIEHWDGQQLDQQQTGIHSRSGHVASALSAVAAAGDRLIAVGWRVAASAPTQLPAALLGRD